MAAVPSIGADATRDLYERYGRQIYAYCLHQLGSREEAEDATQTTFLNAFRGLQRGVVPELETAWLYKIAANVVLTRRRSSYRRRRVEAPGDLDALQDVLAAPQGETDELVRLREALAAMPEQQRHALLLREWQGLSYREIGERLELSQGAVETLLFRARRSLATGLSRLRSGLDLGWLVAAAKTLLSGGAAVKVAVTAAAVATTAVGAGTEVTRHHVQPEPRAPKTVPAASAPVPRHVAAVVAPVRHVAAPPKAKPVHRVVRRPAAVRVAEPVAQPAPVVAEPEASPVPVVAEPVVEAPQPEPAPAPVPVVAQPAPAATPAPMPVVVAGP
jgi:RNA polymerase sigma factor (sigma-70 family)